MSARIEGYTLGDRLHADARSELYAAVRDVDRVSVLLRFPLQPVMRRAERLQRELELLRRIHAPSVAQALSVEEHREHPALVMRGFDGVSLVRSVVERPFSPRETLDIGIELSDALVAIHASRIVHNQLSPASVLVGATRRSAQIIDFESALEIGQHARTERGTDAPLRYVAPECANEVEFTSDPRADLYSLGAVLYELLC